MRHAPRARCCCAARADAAGSLRGQAAEPSALAAEGERLAALTRSLLVQLEGKCGGRVVSNGPELPPSPPAQGDAGAGVWPRPSPTPLPAQLGAPGCLLLRRSAPAPMLYSERGWRFDRRARPRWQQELRLPPARWRRLPNTLSVAFPGAGASDVLAALAGVVSASAGAACHSNGSNGSSAGSSVLSAMGAPAEVCRGTVQHPPSPTPPGDGCAWFFFFVLTFLYAPPSRTNPRVPSTHPSPVPTRGRAQVRLSLGSGSTASEVPARPPRNMSS